METKQAIVLTSGWEAQVENTNEIRPLTKEHTPGAKVEVREVWQWILPGGTWCTDTQINNGVHSYDYFEYYYKMMDNDYRTRIAFEVVSEEESKPDQQPFEAHPRLADILLHASNHWKVDTTNWNALLAEINKICTLYSELEKVTDKVEDLQILLDAERNAIQSGEYVRVSDVVKMIEAEIVHQWQDDSYYTQQVLRNILTEITTLKTNK